MSATLIDLIASHVESSGLDQSDLAPGDVRFLEDGIEKLLASLKARQAWERHIGPILTHQQVLDVTGWTKQALSYAVKQHRVLRLTAQDKSNGYLAAGFDEEAPARPLAGIKDVFAAFANAEVDGWTVASWFSSPQVELGGKTPREALIGGGQPVDVAARQASARLAA